MTSFFYVVSIAFHTSVPVLRKCMNTSRKKILLAESAATRAQCQGESVTELMPFMNFLVRPYTCCSYRYASPYWQFIRRWISMGFTPSLLKKRMRERCSSVVHVARGATNIYYCCAVMFIPASYCHLSATLQTMSITADNLQDNRAALWNFIAHLGFSFDCPSYLNNVRNS